MVCAAEKIPGTWYTIRAPLYNNEQEIVRAATAKTATNWFVN